MREDSLRELLSQVHERLSRTDGALDTESRELLVTLMGDIERTLGRASSGRPGTRSTDTEAMPRLEALAVRFEAEHPALARTLRQLMDALGKAGI